MRKNDLEVLKNSNKTYTLKKKPNILFVHIAKTAGTSIRNSLIMNGNELEFNSHIVSTKIIKKIGKKRWNSMFKFCFVRNPYDRLVSFYHFMTIPREIPREKERIWREKRQRIIGERTFEEFCFMFYKNKILKKTPGLLQQNKYICNKNDKIIVDFIGRYESLEEDWDYLCKNIFQKEYVLPHEQLSNHRKDYMSYYNEETKRIVANYYKKDFEMFDYDYGINNE